MRGFDFDDSPPPPLSPLEELRIKGPEGVDPFRASSSSGRLLPRHIINFTNDAVS
jgi:hypothetical protein